MFVLTADQVGSRTSPDLVAEVTAALRGRFGSDLVLGPDRTAGDEFEVVTEGATAALQVALHLLRLRTWSVGLGIGPVDTPLPATAREAAGDGFVLARDAVDRAKRRPHRFALAAAAVADGGGVLQGDDVQSLVELLLAVRDRRSAEGWEVVDLLQAEGSQVAVAARLGVTPQAVSLRARVAGLREELDALPAITTLLAGLDGASV
jgi:hypothetical protein